MSTYHEISIQPAHSGFGEFVCSLDIGEGYADEIDLLSEITGNVGDVWRLGDDELPEGCDDIRGRIRNEPRDVYAYRDDSGDFRYFGIAEL